MKTLNIGIVGLGTVGQGVVRLLESASDRIAGREGLSVRIGHAVVRDVSKSRDVTLPDCQVHTDLGAVLADPSIEVIIEVAGGTTIAADAVFGALQAGKHVVTANKELLALRGGEILARAADAGRCVGFEASCVGGVPIIGALRTGLAANRIKRLIGIVNGTCNYILTEMLAERKSYAAALAEAQAAGFAEADPTLDVGGHDSAHKLTVLGSLAFGAAIEFERVHVEGIERIELTDLLAGRELGYVCKLLAIAERQGDAINLRVHPAFINDDHPLAAVSGSFNAVSVYGDAVGHTLFYGRGAGAMPTASAVVADLIEIGTGRAKPPAVAAHTNTPPTYQPIDSLVTRYYLRMNAIDRPNVMAKIATVLGDHEISLRAVVQHEPPDGRTDGAVPIVVTTHAANESAVRDAVNEIAALDVVTDAPVCIRVVDDIAE